MKDLGADRRDDRGLVRDARGWSAAAVAVVLVGSACATRPIVTSPSSPAISACPIEGCAASSQRNDGEAPDAVLGSYVSCASDGESPCGGASAAECRERALSAWSDAVDERAVACVARMLVEACSLDDASACGFAGRLLLDGRGVSRDVKRAIDMLVRACDGGIARACAVTAGWLGDATHAASLAGAAQELLARVEGQRTCLQGQAETCFQIGILFYYGQGSFPRDRAKSSKAFARGCDLDDSRACNNLGDALAYGDGVARDVESASLRFLKACRLGEALGCANLGFMTEHGEGVARDRTRARALYRDACRAGDVYGCLHVDLLSAEDAGAPRDPTRALAHFGRICDERRNARACAFVGVIYEDGPDGLSRDEAKSLRAMARACELGDGLACEWVTSHVD